jgi:hypothetical protein
VLLPLVAAAAVADRRGGVVERYPLTEETQQQWYQPARLDEI